MLSQVNALGMSQSNFKYWILTIGLCSTSKHFWLIMVTKDSSPPNLCYRTLATAAELNAAHDELAYKHRCAVPEPFLHHWQNACIFFALIIISQVTTRRINGRRSKQRDNIYQSALRNRTLLYAYFDHLFQITEMYHCTAELLRCQYYILQLCAVGNVFSENTSDW